MSKNKKIIVWTTSLLTLAILLVLATIFDLSISKNLSLVRPGSYYTSNAFVAIFEIIGETGLHLIVSFSLCVILFYFISKQIFKNKWLNYILYALIVCANVLVCWFAVNKIFDATAHYLVELNDYLASFVGKITIVLLGVMLNLLVVYLTGKIKKDFLPNLFRWAIFVLISAAICIVCVKVLKVLFGRIRFRAMTYVGDTDFAYYTNWFSINTKKFESISVYASDFFKSFPSGHAGAAASGILLVLLPKFVPQFDNKKWKISTVAVTAVFTILVSFSRILAGAHFLTDVMVGAAITIFIAILTLFVYQKVESKIHNKKVATSKEGSKDNPQAEEDNKEKEENKSSSYQEILNKIKEGKKKETSTTDSK